MLIESVLYSQGIGKSSSKFDLIINNDKHELFTVKFIFRIFSIVLLNAVYKWHTYCYVFQEDFCTVYTKWTYE